MDKETFKNLTRFDEKLQVVATPTLTFAKTENEAIIPSKRDEDGAFDFYAHIAPEERIVNDNEMADVREQLLPVGQVSFVNTGIATAMPQDFCMSFKNERSSFAKHGAVVLAGLIDSGYRGPIKVMVLPLVKDILITDQVDAVEEYTDVVLIPYKKAFAQGRLEFVPSIETKEITYEELEAIPSERGTGGWGSSGK